MPTPASSIARPLQNKAPDFIKGTFVWRVNLGDSPDVLERAERDIATVQNLLDRTVRSNIFVSGLIGLDHGLQNWDGCWPYLLRPTFRVGHDWKNTAAFMLACRDKHGAWISFHTNITDVNVGLREHPEMQEFFNKLRDAKACYTRKGYGCGIPFKGPAYVPQEIPTTFATMDYAQPGEGWDIFAIVNYKNFWESGLAKEMLDQFFDLLPYAPPVLYTDVLTTTGSNLTAGLPDGLLGGSLDTQTEGRQKILDYIRSKGSEPGGECILDCTHYNWGHGGMSFNDYSRIQTGYAQGGKAWRGPQWQHVYGNQGSYTLDMDGVFIARNVKYQAVEGGAVVMMGSTEVADPANAVFDETAEWRTVAQVVDGFYLTVIQELYHIGLGNVRLPGGASTERLDEHRGRVRLDRFDLYQNLPDGGHQHLGGAQADEGEIATPCFVEKDPGATNGRVVSRLEESLDGSCTVTIDVPESALGGQSTVEGTLVVCYNSTLGGTAEVELNGEWLGEIDFTPTARVSLFSAQALADYAGTTAGIFGNRAIPVTLRPGANTVTVRKGSIHALWSDGTQARWDRNGFRAWNGNVTFGVGYDRMWPDTWSGEAKIYFYSREGSERAWQLPEEWLARAAANGNRLTLYPLTGEGRGAAISVPVQDGKVTVKLEPGQPAVLV